VRCCEWFAFSSMSASPAVSELRYLIVQCAALRSAGAEARELRVRVQARPASAAHKQQVRCCEWVWQHVCEPGCSWIALWYSGLCSVA
jgi:hypothetical protein